MAEFEWDEGKRASNLKKHGVDFADAALIFEGRILTRVDDRKDYREQRLISLGMADGECFVVVHTRREAATRIISAWKGGQDDKVFYHKIVAE